jgi:uncharacterized membrane protein
MAQFHVMAGAGETYNHVAVRKISLSDVTASLRQGAEDFWEKPSHYVFLCIIYPLVGVVLATWTSGNNALPLLFPLMSGFALLGPIAAIGLYEISRRRELGMDTSWVHAFDVRHSSALPSIVAVGIWLFALFIAWLLVAQAIYAMTFGSEPPTSIGTFIRDVLTTDRGWSLILWGNLVGLVFAIVALATTVIAFPLLLDRDVGVIAAMEASARALIVNPLPMLFWGLLVAVGLVIGSIPLFAGLAVVMPIFGHATWHLYRKVVEPSVTASSKAAEKRRGSLKAAAKRA